MELVQRPKNKKIVWMIAVLVAVLIALALFEILRYKPLPPEVGENGEILGTPFNGFRKFPTDPVKN